LFSSDPENLILIKCISIPALAAWFSFYIMDIRWYHKLLIGAVRHGIENIEDRYIERLPFIGLASTIRDEAHNSIFGERAAFKLSLFYLIGALVIVSPWFLSLKPFFMFMSNTVLYW